MWQYFSRSAPAAQDASDASEATTSTSNSASSSFSFARLSSYVYDKAADVAFDLAPVEQSLSLLRISAVLVELSRLVYVTHNGDVQQQTHVDLPLLGSYSNRTTVACKLLHFRSASLTLLPALQLAFARSVLEALYNYMGQQRLHPCCAERPPKISTYSHHSSMAFGKLRA